MGKSAKKIIRSLIVQGDSEDNKDRSKIIKSLDPIEPNKGNPIKLRSLANKTPEERDVILEKWKSSETVDRLNHEIVVEEGDMARMKILLDWYVEGYSIQADSFDQLEWIKYFISRDYPNLVPTELGFFNNHLMNRRIRRELLHRLHLLHLRFIQEILF